MRAPAPDVADAKQCRGALRRLAATFDTLDPDLRSRHVPQRSVICRIKDLDVVFTARVDDTGVHDIVQLSPEAAPLQTADVRVTVASDDLVALADGEDDLLSAWLHGRVQVSAPVRDMLRLRVLLGI